MTRRAFAGLLLLLGTSACAKAVIDTVDDVTVAAAVKTALLNDTQIDATTIDVTVTNGVVTLSGTVKSKAEESRAIELARHASGVRDVRSKLKLNTEN